MSTLKWVFILSMFPFSVLCIIHTYMQAYSNKELSCNKPNEIFILIVLFFSVQSMIKQLFELYNCTLLCLQLFVATVTAIESEYM